VVTRLRLGFSLFLVLTIAGCGGSGKSPGATPLGGGEPPPSSGSLALLAASYSVVQGGGSANLTVGRAGGAAGAVSVTYATVDGTATAPANYTSASGTLQWADGDSSSRTIAVPVGATPALSGNEDFRVVLSNPGGGASLGVLASAVVTISPAIVPACAQGASSIVYSYNSTNGQGSYVYSYVNQGVYNLIFDDWGPQSGTLTQWINGPGCWGESVTNTADLGVPGSSPGVSRGWSNDATILQALSTAGSPSAPNWTTLSGLGLAVSAITKVHVKWSMSVPTVPNAGDTVSRWDALIDIYFHTAAEGAPNPPASAWFPHIDLQIMQMLMDSPLAGQPAGQGGYFAYVMSNNHPWIKTIGGVTYIGVIDAFHYNQPGGHTITMMPEPTIATNPGTAELLWGQPSMVHDVGGIIAWLSQQDPTDDSGAPVQVNTSSGPVPASSLSAPVIPPSIYLSAITSGFEVDFGSAGNNQWTTTGYWVAVQNEPDGP